MLKSFIDLGREIVFTKELLEYLAIWVLALSLMLAVGVELIERQDKKEQEKKLERGGSGI